MIRYWVFACLCFSMPGCFTSDNQFVDVSGVIKQDGKPLEGATVMFVPKQAKNSAGRKLPIAHGVTGSDGRYQLSMPGGANGAAVGVHTVMVSKIDPLYDPNRVSKKLARKNSHVALIHFLTPQHKRELLLQSVLIADPNRTAQPLGEMVFDSFNRESILQFEVNSGGTASADFEVGRDPLLEN